MLYCTTQNTGVSFTTYKESMYALFKYIGNLVSEFRQESLFPQALPIVSAMVLILARNKWDIHMHWRDFNKTTTYKAVITTEKIMEAGEAPKLLQMQYSLPLVDLQGQGEGAVGWIQSVCGQDHWSFDLNSE